MSAFVAFFSAFEIYVRVHCRHSALETTVAEARIEAHDALTAHQIEVNAEEAHNAAEHAASVAKVCIIISWFIPCG